MKYFGTLFLLIFLTLSYSGEEPLPQWLKVYQRVEPAQFQDSTVPSSTLTYRSTLESSEVSYKSTTNSISVEFPSTLRLRDYIRGEFKSGRYAEVVPYLTEILRREPDHTEMLYMMAYSLRKNKLWEQAVVFYDSLLTRKPEFKEALYERALVLKKLN